jgi:hypothetical protein
MAGAFGGNKGGTPDAPDFSKLAMVNQNNPLGGSTWQTDPTTGQITTSSQFGGQAGQTFQGLLGGMNQAAGMDPAAAGQQAFDKTMGSYKSVLDPMWAANADKMQTGLANSGLEPGTEAYSNASRTFGNQRDQAYNSAIAGAVQGGQAEQAQARANANQPFLQAAGMMGMLPHNDPTAPFKGGAAQYDAAKDRSSANNAKKGNTIGGLANIAGTAFGGPLGGAAASGLMGGGGGQGTNITMPQLL